MRAPCCVTGWLTEVTGAEVPGKRSTNPPFCPGRPGPMATPFSAGGRITAWPSSQGRFSASSCPIDPSGRMPGPSGRVVSPNVSNCCADAGRGGDQPQRQGMAAKRARIMIRPRR
jgi:hypothetical protein